MAVYEKRWNFELLWFYTILFVKVLYGSNIEKKLSLISVISADFIKLETQQAIIVIILIT